VCAYHFFFIHRSFPTMATFRSGTGQGIPHSLSHHRGSNLSPSTVERLAYRSLAGRGVDKSASALRFTVTFPLEMETLDTTLLWVMRKAFPPVISKG